MEIKERRKLSRYMWYTRTSMRLIGLWPTGRSGILGLCYFVIVAGNFIGRAFQMVANCWINYTDFETAAESLSPMMTLITCFGKMCIYRHQRSRLGRLVVTLENCLKHGPDDVLDNLEDYAKIASLGCGYLLAASWLQTVVFLSTPLFVAGDEKLLPFPSWYPFDYENSTIFYAVAYGHEVCITILGNCGLSVEITFIWLTMHSCSRFRVLSHRLSNLPGRKSRRTSKDDGSSGVDAEETFLGKVDAELSSLMELHHQVLRDLNEINTAYTYLIMILFFAALIAICCAGLQITSASTGSFNVTACLFICLTLYYAEQLFLYYLPGEVVAQEAMKVSFAAYDSGWESLRTKQQKVIRIMIMRSQLPPKLLVGQLRPLRLENYSAFLTTTASYFTSLRAVAGSP